MSKLTYQAREGLSGGAFVFPKERRYPIHDESHARNALARASGKSDEAKVRAAVHARYPNIGKEKEAEFNGKHLALLSALAIGSGVGLGRVKADNIEWANVPSALASKVTGQPFDPHKASTERWMKNVAWHPPRPTVMADSPKFMRQIAGKIRTASVHGFTDEIEKIALKGSTVWGAFRKRVAHEMAVPHQVQDLAEGIVEKGHPIYKKWMLRTIPVGRSR